MYGTLLGFPQISYTTIERELLSIVETLKEFHTILLGHRIIEYTYHKNLTFDKLITERVLRWRLMLEYYSPEIKYINGTDNEAAEALSRLPSINLT